MGALLRLWHRDQRGVSAVEFALVAPLLLLVLLGSVTLFDLFRTSQSAEKSTFTVGDMLSRQTLIDDAQMTSMLTFLNKTVDYEGEARLRVSSISNIRGTLEIDWTEAVGNTEIDMGSVNLGLIPDLAVGDSVILTESFIPHEAFVAGFGVDSVVYSNKSTHRPRFVGRIVYQ